MEARIQQTFLEQSFREIAIASLGSMIIVVPTDRTGDPMVKNPLRQQTSKRIYSEKGWLFEGDHWIGLLQGVHFEPFCPPDSPFKLSPRLSLGIPVSFEVSSNHPLPKSIAKQAAFLYQFDQEPGTYYGIFQKMIPQLVCIYPFVSPQLFREQIRCLLDKAT